jgi:hypothetical protein
VSLGVIVVSVGASVVISLVLTWGAEPDVEVRAAAGRTDLVEDPGGEPPDDEREQDGPATGQDDQRPAGGRA